MIIAGAVNLVTQLSNVSTTTTYSTIFLPTYISGEIEAISLFAASALQAGSPGTCQWAIDVSPDAGTTWFEYMISDPWEATVSSASLTTNSILERPIEPYVRTRAIVTGATSWQQLTVQLRYSLRRASI